MDALDEFVIRHAAEIRRAGALLHRGADLSEARVWVHQTFVNVLRADHDGNDALTHRWNVAHHEAWRNFDIQHDRFEEALGEWRFDPRRLGFDPRILASGMEIDTAADGASRAADECKAAARVDGALLCRGLDRFESWRQRHELLLAAFRRRYRERPHINPP